MDSVRREGIGRTRARQVRRLRLTAAGIAAACLSAPIAQAKDGSYRPVGEPAARSMRLTGEVLLLGPKRVVRDPAPEPGLGPDAVVDIVLRALQHNDDPVADHGIAVTFAFTSPENRDVTGPIDRFRALVKSSAYRPMIGHTRAARGPVEVVAQHAREQVAITGANGERAVYLFLLSRQETGAYKGCWMADGVLREPAAARRDAPLPLVSAVVLRRD